MSCDFGVDLNDAGCKRSLWQVAQEYKLRVVELEIRLRLSVNEETSCVWGYEFDSLQRSKEEAVVVVKSSSQHSGGPNCRSEGVVSLLSGCAES